MDAGELPRFWKTAASQFWLTTRFPWNTTRPLNFPLVCPSGNSEFFSTQEAKRVSHIDFGTVGLSFCSNFVPVTHDRLVPDVLVAQALPLSRHRELGLDGLAI